MSFSFTEEQQQFRDIVARFCRDQSPPAQVRRQMASDTGVDRALWSRLCADLGLGGLAVPEALGGQGYGAVELGIAMEELGRANAGTPALSSAVLATHALLRVAAPAQQREWLPAICEGACIATLALGEAGGRWEPEASTVMATRRESGWQLDGVKTYVLDGHVADLFLVVARAPGSRGAAGVSLFALRAGTAGLHVEALPSIDPTRRVARVTLAAAPALLLGDEGGAADGLSRALDESLAALSCEMVGGAQALLDATVAYSKLRVQFGRVIGSFQAIKHRLADLLMEVEFARSAAYRAAELAAGNAADLRTAAPMAKALASDAFLLAAQEAVQLHGGIGFTWEHDTHLYFKRARASSALFGGGAEQRERYLSRLAATPSGDRA